MAFKVHNNVVNKYDGLNYRDCSRENHGKLEGKYYVLNNENSLYKTSNGNRFSPKLTLNLHSTFTFLYFLLKHSL